MAELSLELALQDFMPVVASAVGWWFVIRIVARCDAATAPLAALGAILVVAGGLARASWKLLVAMDGPDLAPLHAALYPLLASGFLALAGALMAVHRGRPVGWLTRWLPLALVGVGVIPLVLVSAAVAGDGGRLVPLLWLGVATAGSVAVGILLALRARRVGRPVVALLFLGAIAATLLLNGLARLPDQSEAVQWVEQAANTLNQLVFTLAAWRLWLAESRGGAVVVGEHDATRGAGATPIG